MKRLFSTIITICLLLPLSITAFASSESYHIDELELSLSIPESYWVIMRNISSADPIFNELGTTRSEIISQFEASSIYLNAISKELNEEIVVTMTPNQLTDFNLLSDTSLSAMASILVEQYKSYNISVLKHEIYNQGQTKFIRVYFEDPSQSAFCLQYYTIYSSKAMNFTLRSYGSAISSFQETAIKDIVDSIKFDTEPQLPESGRDTDSFTYEDKESGIKFTVPNNWEEEPLSKEREFIDVKFVSTKEDGILMMFGAANLWEKMSYSERAGYTQADIDDSFVSKSYIADILSLKTDSISEKTYNGIHYYVVEATSKAEAYGIEASVTLTHVLHFQNGWVYWFQFGGTKDSPYFSDFEKMINSASIQNENENENNNNEGQSETQKPGSVHSLADKNSNGSSGSPMTGVLVLLIIIIIAIAIVVFVLIRKIDKNYNNINKTDPSVEAGSKTAPKATPESRSVIYCRHCGMILLNNSEICSKCGAKIQED